MKKILLLFLTALFFAAAANAEATKNMHFTTADLVLIICIAILVPVAGVMAGGFILYFILNQIADLPRKNAWGTIIGAGFALILIFEPLREKHIENTLVVILLLIFSAFAGGCLGYFLSPLREK